MINEAILERAVHQHGELPGSGGDGFGLPSPVGQPAIERAESYGGGAEVNTTNLKCAGGPTGRAVDQEQLLWCRPEIAPWPQAIPCSFSDGPRDQDRHASKDDLYDKLVTERVACRRCERLGLTNPAIVHDSRFDSAEIGPSSRWQGCLDAKLMVVGQD